MNDDNDLDPVARLRAADPAADVEPRAGFADDVIAQATADDDAAADTAAPVTDLGAERARRRPRWLPIAAVAASIAIVGGLGYGVGASTGGTNLAGGGNDLTGGAAAPITLQPATGGGPASGAALPEVYDSALPAPQAMRGYPDIMLPWGSGRTVFTGSGFSDSDGDAHAFGFDPRSVSNEKAVAALASALGVEGTPELKDGAWLVGPTDGSAPMLSVTLDGTMSFGYSNPAINPWKCAEGTDVAVPCEPTGSLPAEDAALDALRALITATGRDTSDFEFTSETYEGAVTRPAQAWPVVDGQRLDQSWYLELSDAGIVSVSGAIAPLVDLGELPIISEQAAFERLSDPRFSVNMTPSAASLREQPVGLQTIEWVPPTEPPATPTSDVAISWPVSTVDLQSVRLGLTSQWQPDGSVLVIPAYEFTDADGSTWSIIAVADSQIDFSPLPRP